MTDKSLGSREGRIQLIEKHLIPKLDSPNWATEFGNDSATVDTASRTLAEEYHDLAIPEVYSTIVIVTLLLAIDYAVYFNPQVYGLFIDIWAALFFVFPSLKGRHVIATAVEGKPKEGVHRLEAQEMVSTNTGFALLAFGFVIQILSVQFFSNAEFVQQNVFSTYLPGWIPGLLLLLALLVGLKSLGKMRERRLSSR